MKDIANHVKAAVSEAISLVEDGDFVGLGSGSTMAYAICELGTFVKRKGFDIKVVPTSFQTKILSLENGLNVIDWMQDKKLDLAIDGADQVELNSLNLIKGGGAALTREKIVDSNSKELIIVIDENKLIERLGHNQPVPIEVIPFGYKAVLKILKDLKGKPKLRESEGKVGPLITDNGNFIIDVIFDPITDLEEMEKRAKLIPGVIETGLFIGITNRVYVGRKNKVEILKK
ncbi:ribose 5-phosphate isomerase A [[Eubacterium] cellulosolvens]